MQPGMRVCLVSLFWFALRQRIVREPQALFPDSSGPALARKESLSIANFNQE